MGGLASQSRRNFFSRHIKAFLGILRRHFPSGVGRPIVGSGWWTQRPPPKPGSAPPPRHMHRSKNGAKYGHWPWQILGQKSIFSPTTGSFLVGAFLQFRFFCAVQPQGTLVGRGGDQTALLPASPNFFPQGSSRDALAATVSLIFNPTSSLGLTLIGSALPSGVFPQGVACFQTRSLFDRSLASSSLSCK